MSTWLLSVTERCHTAEKYASCRVKELVGRAPQKLLWGMKKIYHPRRPYCSGFPSAISPGFTLKRLRHASTVGVKWNRYPSLKKSSQRIRGVCEVRASLSVPDKVQLGSLLLVPMNQNSTWLKLQSKKGESLAEPSEIAHIKTLGGTHFDKRIYA